MRILPDGTILAIENIHSTRPKDKKSFENHQEMVNYLNDVISYSNKQTDALRSASELTASVREVSTILKKQNTLFSVSLAVAAFQDVLKALVGVKDILYG